MVSYYTDYNDISSTSDVADLDYSIDGGATWSNLISWNEDHRGPLQVEQPFAADGEANTLVRWNYTNATWDWWWEVDDVVVTACEAAAPQGTLQCNGPTVGFEDGAFPPDWSITTLALPGGEWLVSTDNSTRSGIPVPRPKASTTPQPTTMRLAPAATVVQTTCTPTSSTCLVRVRRR